MKDVEDGLEAFKSIVILLCRVFLVLLSYSSSLVR